MRSSPRLGAVVEIAGTVDGGAIRSHQWGSLEIRIRHEDLGLFPIGARVIIQGRTPGRRSTKSPTGDGGDRG